MFDAPWTVAAFARLFLGLGRLGRLLLLARLARVPSWFRDLLGFSNSCDGFGGLFFAACRAGEERPGLAGRRGGRGLGCDGPTCYHGRCAAR